MNKKKFMPQNPLKQKQVIFFAFLFLIGNGNVFSQNSAL